MELPAEQRAALCTPEADLKHTSRQLTLHPGLSCGAGHRFDPVPENANHLVSKAILVGHKLIRSRVPLRGRDRANQTTRCDVPFDQRQRRQRHPEPFRGSLELKIDVLVLQLPQWLQIGRTSVSMSCTHRGGWGFYTRRAKCCCAQASRIAVAFAASCCSERTRRFSTGAPASARRSSGLIGWRSAMVRPANAWPT
jgi:hypothetical protein